MEIGVVVILALLLLWTISASKNAEEEANLFQERECWNLDIGNCDFRWIADFDISRWNWSFCDEVKG